MNKKIIYAVVALVVVVLGYLYFSSGGNGSYEYVTIEKRDIVQEVSVTGKVKPVSSAMLAFDRLGKVVRFNVDVGNHVSAGDVLASLDSSELAANLLQAEASVRVQEAKLDELKRGARTEDLEVSYAERDSATTALVDAKKGLVEKINDAYTKSDDAIRNRVDRMFTNPRSANPELVFIVADATLSDQIKAERVILEGVLNNWNSSLGSLSSGADLGKYVSEAYANLEKIKSFLDKMALAVSGLTTNATLTQTTLDTYKSETATSRTNINSAISALVAADEKMRAADSALRVASQQLALKQAGTSDEEIRAQEAAVEEARANVSSIRAQIGKTILRSPISGIITKKDFEVGEIVSANEPVLYVISDNNFEMEANVPEADIAKVDIGDAAKVTLDAYGPDVVFDSVVTKIDPAETMIEGVATYKTTLSFVKKDERVKSGMTANIDILTDKKEGVPAVPQRAVSAEDGERFVMLNTGGDTPEKRVIVVGLRGSDGYTEVLSGLVEGDKIVGLAE